VNGIELYRLSRRLTKLAVRAIPPSEFRELPTGVRMVLVDVIENPDSTIGQIVDRTGFPQSHVSASVARLRDSGMLITMIDPNDRRRTLVAPSKAHIAKVKRSRSRHEPIDAVVKAALIDDFGPTGAEHLDEVTEALNVLSRLLTPPIIPAPELCAEGAPPC
jgi:DNA-binding MarR family transcriptional regulator